MTLSTLEVRIHFPRLDAFPAAEVGSRGGGYPKITAGAISCLTKGTYLGHRLGVGRAANLFEGCGQSNYAVRLPLPDLLLLLRVLLCARVFWRGMVADLKSS